MSSYHHALIKRPAKKKIKGSWVQANFKGNSKGGYAIEN